MARQEANNRRIDTVIGKDTVFVGNIESAGTIRVDGKIEGEVITEGDLIIGEFGAIQGKISAKMLLLRDSLWAKLRPVVSWNWYRRPMSKAMPRSCSLLLKKGLSSKVDVNRYPGLI